MAATRDPDARNCFVCNRPLDDTEIEYMIPQSDYSVSIHEDCKENAPLHPHAVLDRQESGR